MTGSRDLFMPQQSYKMENHPQFTDEETSSKGFLVSLLLL